MFTDVAVNPLFTVSEKLAVPVAWLPSVIVTVYIVCGLATVGVPVIAPVDVFRLSPAGRDGEML